VAAEPAMERTLTIVNKLGLHARAAAKLVTLAGKYRSDIRVKKDAREVSGKSIMGVMMLAAAKGSRLTFRAEGPDAQQALDAIEALIGRKFDEAA
jgi:phosphocarrier protein HPr